ncbi:hypothetical protein C7S10_10965 [Nocardioides currus]|uniref:DUF2975 domain-containing protein n=2 Tax=Nocardioides currus TaxID=2133958 RepID=A0A2R7YX07_9ACTN|nr:hypothetical protein C7S10_10965 [Nocardioides currus]
MWSTCAVADLLTYRFSLLSFIVMLSMNDKPEEHEMAGKSLFTFDRWDYLGTRVVLGAVALASVSFGVVVPLVQMLQGDALTWQLQTGKTDALATDQLGVKPGAELTWPGTADVRIEDAGVGTWLASIAPGALLATATVVVVVALLRLLSSIQSREPFAPAAVRSLRVVGATLLLGAVAVTVAASLANQAVLRAAVELRGEPSTFTLALGPVVVIAGAGLVCAALAEAFNHGIALADDVEGLV